MRIANALTILLLANPIAWAGPQSIMQKMGLTSQLCFVQPEVSGRMNVEESSVALDNDQSVTLMGGEAACLYVFPGSHSFTIEYLNSERLFPNKSKSPKYKTTLHEGERTVFEVYPTMTKSGEYTGGWRARLIHQRAGEK